MTIALTGDELREARHLMDELGLDPTRTVHLDRDRQDNLTLTEPASGEIFPVMLEASRDSRVRQWHKANR